MPEKKSLSGNLTLLTGFIVFLFAVGVPTGYFLSNYQYLAGDLHSDAEFIAHNASEVISKNPEMWEYESIRLREIISKAKDFELKEARILNSDGTVVVEMDRHVRKPAMRKQVAFYDAGVPVGKVEISQSLVPLIGNTFALGFVSLGIGWLFFYLIQTMPLRELHEAEKALLASEKKFRNLVEEAPLAMTLVNKTGELEYINKKNFEVIGYSHNETPTLESWWSLAYPDPEERKKITALWGDIQHRVLRGENVGITERRIKCKDGTTKYMELRFSRAGDKVLVIFDDISERKQAEETLKRYSAELEKSNRLFQEAIANVKQLSGMLPICASCKKIRDDKGYWSQVESYISEHTDTVFSHGLCPECEKKAYEEFEKFEKQ